MRAFSYIQWKIAMARMQDANMAASEITEQGGLTQPAAPKIAEYHLDRYFEMVEAELNSESRAARHERRAYSGVIGNRDWARADWSTVVGRSPR